MNHTFRYGPIVLLGCLLWSVHLVIEPFVVPLIWAAILGYATWPVYARLRAIFSGRDFTPALLLTITLTGLVVAPLIGALVVLREEIIAVIPSLPGWLEQKPTLPSFIARLPFVGKELGHLLNQFDDFQSLIKARLLPLLRTYTGDFVTILGGVGYNVAKLFIALLSLFFVYRGGPRIADHLRKTGSILLGESSERYFRAVEATLRAVLYGIILTALAQGVLAGLGYWATGMDAPITLGVLTAIFSMLPFGTPLVWGSASVWLFLHDERWPALALALWGGLVVSWVDNIIRPVVISNTARIPFLVVLFGVLGGLAKFGLIGLFLGPMILAIGLAAWREWLLSVDESGDELRP